MILYPLTFRYIIVHTNNLSGMLHPDIYRQRKQRNAFNIYMTFWTWLFQCIVG
jgi:hypothetical protein